MKSHFSRSKLKIIHYRNFKRFDKQNFFADVKNADFSFESDDPNENYSTLTNTISLIVEKYAPLKKKTVKGNHAPFYYKGSKKTYLHKKQTKKQIY